MHIKQYAQTQPVGKKGDCTISMKDSDFMNMVMGKLGPQKVGADIIPEYWTLLSILPWVPYLF